MNTKLISFQQYRFTIRVFTGHKLQTLLSIFAPLSTQSSPNILNISFITRNSLIPCDALSLYITIQTTLQSPSKTNLSYTKNRQNSEILSDLLILCLWTQKLTKLPLQSSKLPTTQQSNIFYRLLCMTSFSNIHKTTPITDLLSLMHSKEFSMK